MSELRCGQCGGPLRMSRDDAVVFPTVTVTMGPVDRPGSIGRVTEVHGDAWCGACLRAWDEATGLAGREMPGAARSGYARAPVKPGETFTLFKTFTRRDLPGASQGDD